MIELEGSVRRPRLLRRDTPDAAPREIGRLRPLSASAEMNLAPLSSAHLTLGADDLPVRIHDFAELYGQNGSLGVFRVTSVTTDDSGRRSVRLTHALDVLGDALLEAGEAATAGQALAAILAAQANPCWQLGEAACEAPFSWSAGDALQALRSLAQEQSGFCFAFDFSAFPWTLHFRALSGEVKSEFRLPRNIRNCRAELDDRALCTRLILTVERDGQDDARQTYDNAAAQAVWGVVTRAATVNAAGVSDPAAWANAYLTRHAQPSARIVVDGLELNRLTGERLDRAAPGDLCRVALPEYGAWFAERVASVSYPDLLLHPSRVTVSLAGEQDTAGAALARLAGQMKTAQTLARESGRRAEEAVTRWRATDRHVTDIGEILHAAGLELDAHGVWLYASEQGANYALGSSFKVQADAISGIVQKTGVNSVGQGETLYSKITQNANSISTEVTQRVNGETVLQSQITQNASAITLKANQVTVEGLQTNLNATTTRVSSLVAGSSTFSLVNAQAIRLAGYSLFLANGYVRYGSGD